MRLRFAWLRRIGDCLGSLLVALVSIGRCLVYKYITSLRLKVDVLILFSALSERWNWISESWKLVF